MIKVTQSELSGAIAVINGFAKSPSGSSSNPALKYVTLQTSSDGKFLTMSAWDSIKGARWKIPLSGGNELPLSAIAASDLRDFVVRLPEGGELELKIVANGLRVKMGKSFRVFPCLPEADMNLMPSLDSEEVSATIFPDELIRASDQCFCYSDIEGDLLAGALLEWNKAGSRFTAIASNRSVTVLSEVECNVLGDARVILPGDSLKAIAATLKKQPKAIAIKVRLNSASIQLDIFSAVDDGELLSTLYSRVLTGNFPAVEDVRNKCRSFIEEEVLVYGAGLIEGLERILLAVKQGRGYAEFHFSENTLLINAPATQDGAAEESITIKPNPRYDASGKEIEAGRDATSKPISRVFNVKFLLETLKTITSKDVIIGLCAESMPAFLSPASEVKCEYLVMPINVPTAK